PQFFNRLIEILFGLRGVFLKMIIISEFNQKRSLIVSFKSVLDFPLRIGITLKLLKAFNITLKVESLIGLTFRELFVADQRLLEIALVVIMLRQLLVLGNGSH